MKIFSLIIAALFLAFTVTGCLNHRHHKKNRSVQSKPTLYVKPQATPEAKPVLPVPGIIAQKEKQPAQEPIKVVPVEPINVPVGPSKDIEPEKKESEGWWFW